MQRPWRQRCPQWEAWATRLQRLRATRRRRRRWPSRGPGGQGGAPPPADHLQPLTQRCSRLADLSKRICDHPPGPPGAKKGLIGPSPAPASPTGFAMLSWLSDPNTAWPPFWNPAASRATRRRRAGNCPRRCCPRFWGLCPRRCRRCHGQPALPAVRQVRSSGRRPPTEARKRPSARGFAAAASLLGRQQMTLRLSGPPAPSAGRRATPPSEHCPSPRRVPWLAPMPRPGLAAARCLKPRMG
mmetsp:Transcript_26413/g.74201  ORF Transcript_26413/g.74201 Transcript_26413/m.74201 type:complete len:242 (-) Transcript_26413:110-835(-)